MSLLAAGALLAALPALLGDWVYDDRVLPWHPLLDGLDDVWRALGRSSDSYLALVSAAGAPVATGTTYRPLPMMSLALTNALLGAEPLWHHALSALFHVVSIVLLAKLFEARGQLTFRGWWVVSVFALHPGIAEAYQWINGRSDAMAGACLVLLALAQLRVQSSMSRWLLSTLCLVCGALCKETFLVAAAALLLALAVMAAPRERALRTAALSAGAWLVATACMLIGRQLSVTRAGGVPRIDLGELGARLPHLLAVATETLLVPRAQSMRLLSWELDKPWRLGELLALAALFLGCGYLAYARRFKQLVLLAGAFATLLPALLISGGFWFGFDRYLYMPACLIALCFVPGAGAVGAEHALPKRRMQVGALIGTLLVLGFVQYQASSAYRTHGTWVRAMVELRPDDPSGYVLAAQEAFATRKTERAQRLLMAMPTTELPVAHAHRVIDAWLFMDQPARAAELAEAGLRRHADEPRLTIGLATARARQGRLGEAEALYTRALAQAGDRSAVRATLANRLQQQLARRDLPEDSAKRLRELLHQAQRSASK